MPISTPELASFTAPQIARLHVVALREQMQTAMHTALQEMEHVLQQQHVRPVGPWFAHHHRRPAETFDFDLCFPISGAIEPSGRVDNATIPPTQVLRSVYTGPYEGLPQAWPEFMSWIESHGYRTREDIFEVYAVGPRQERDPSQWQTVMNYPLADQGVAQS